MGSNRINSPKTSTYSLRSSKNTQPTLGAPVQSSDPSTPAGIHVSIKREQVIGGSLRKKIVVARWTDLNDDLVKLTASHLGTRELAAMSLVDKRTNKTLQFLLEKPKKNYLLKKISQSLTRMVTQNTASNKRTAQASIEKMISQLDPETRFSEWRRYIKILLCRPVSERAEFLDHLRKKLPNVDLSDDQKRELSLDIQQILRDIAMRKSSGGRF